jgi:hypothetical protein
VSEKKTRLEQALDLFVYAPLGLALTAREELPHLVEKGRKQLSEQMTTARVMGEYALSEGQKDLERRTKQMSETLSGLSRTRRPSAPARPPASPAVPSTAASAPAAPSAFVPAAPAASTPSPARPSDDELAIPGYDALSASQVVQRLAGLSTSELEAVRAYESATRGRKTILHRVDQLQAGPAA